MAAETGQPLVVELAVEGMMCMKNCGTTVQSALRSVDGVARAVVDFEQRTAHVECVPGASVTADDLVDVVDFEQRTAHVECVPGASVTADDLVDAVECVGFGAAVKASAN
ncbi:hypothetical protein PC116_g28087, partial [Phytophthora cactorum]